MRIYTRTNINAGATIVSLSLVLFSIFSAWHGQYDRATYNLILAFYLAKV